MSGVEVKEIERLVREAIAKPMSLFEALDYIEDVIEDMQDIRNEVNAKVDAARARGEKVS